MPPTDRKKACVYLVLCIDTEGPCADPQNPELLATWNAVDSAMDRLFDVRFRLRYSDSVGGHLKIGWFFLTWTGFKVNPRKRDFGYHAVRDHYIARWGSVLGSFGDDQCWHYHHPSPGGVGNEWGLDWGICREYDQIISRQILERGWFPVCYRAGGTIVDSVSSRWVDAWFPIDYSSRAPLNIPGLVDWSTGINEWSIYHPAPEEFRTPGAGRRYMARCLDLMTTAYTLSDQDITAAFERADHGEPAILACFDHDYRDITERIDQLRMRVRAIAARFPDVSWEYTSPVEAVRRYVEAPPQPRLGIEACHHNGEVRVWSTAPLFQSIPWLAVRSKDGEIHHVQSDFVREDETHWRWKPASDTEWVEAGFGGSTLLGQSAVAKITPNNSSLKVFLNCPMQAHALHPRSIWEHSKVFPDSCVARASGEAQETDSIRQARDLLRCRLRPGMTVLDVGCAAGHGWRSFRELDVQYFGIDSYERGIEIGRQYLAAAGLARNHLRVLAIEDLPVEEKYDAVICLNTLSYFPMYHLPLEIMARAALGWLVIRSSFSDRTEIRYLPDVLLEPGYQALRSYFNIFDRSEIQAFLEKEGFAVRWYPDQRQSEKFDGRPEVVGGIELPYEFLLAERVRPAPDEGETLGEYFDTAARTWRERREGGPNP